jgi:hypothetical protein
MGILPDKICYFNIECMFKKVIQSLNSKGCNLSTCVASTSSEYTQLLSALSSPGLM